LIAYSPDDFNREREYLEYYPGDESVDILGHDNYKDTASKGNLRRFVSKAALVARIAHRKGKIAALTEIGAENVPFPEYWTRRVLRPLLSNKDAMKTVFALFWRNRDIHHHYAPYPGHASVPDFWKFTQHPFVRMGGDRSLYRCSENRR
jgi:mannan endo-1,4-beta-mannosidase